MVRIGSSHVGPAAPSAQDRTEQVQLHLKDAHQECPDGFALSQTFQPFVEAWNDLARVKRFKLFFPEPEERVVVKSCPFAAKCERDKFSLPPWGAPRIRRVIMLSTPSTPERA